MFKNTEESKALEEDLADYGTKAAPIMGELPKKLSELVSAMLCTPEGFNICAIGFEDKHIAKMAAVSSSLYGMAKSVLDAFSGKKDGSMDTITIHSDDLDILGKKIELANTKELILIVATRNTQPGLQLYASRFVETELQKIFSNS